jgi:phosphate transport system substrate-binding protein
MIRHVSWIPLVVALLAPAAGCGEKTKMIQNKGSDTMINLAQALAEEYAKVEPGVPIAVSGGGTGVGIASMQNGTVDVANASREMKQREKDSTRKRTGKDAIEHVVGYDALAIYVHNNNPLQRITKAQLACIYGKEGTCTRWSDLGVEVRGCSGQEIVRVSRQNNSGTYAYFREWTLGKGKDFKLGSRDLSGSKDVVDLVAHTPCAIGYSGMGYKTNAVRWVCLAKEDKDTCVEPSLAATLDGTYKLSRPLYMITRGDPNPDVVAYLHWVRSDAGQAIVERTGYAPLPHDQRSK